MNPDESSPPPSPPPASPVPWRIVGMALAAVGAITGAGLWWNHHQDKKSAQGPAPALPAASKLPEEVGAVPPPAAAAPEPVPAAPAPAPSGPLTPLTLLTPPTPPEPPPPPDKTAKPETASASSPAPDGGPDADRQARLEKYNRLRDQMKAEKDAAEAVNAATAALAPLLPPPAAFPESVVPAAPASAAAAARPAPLPPTAAGELKFVPGPLQASREGASAAFALPGIGAPAPPAAAPPDDDGGVPESGPGLKSVDFGAVSDEGAPANRVPAPALPFVLLSRVVPSPWDADSELVFVGLQPVAPAQIAKPKANIVFLVDDSISMGDPGKLPLLRQAVGKFLDRLGPDDRVALVVYAGDSALLLPSTPVGANKEMIRASFAPNRLAAVASGRPGVSLQIAYDIARQNFVPDGFNRVVAVTDGDLNLGVGESGGLYDYVTRHARDGITLSIIGLGDDFAIGPKVRQLLRAGRGRAVSAHTEGAVGLALDKEIAAPPAESVRDLRFDLPVGPDRAAAWRLVGYQNRLAASAGGGFLAVYEVRKKTPAAGAPAPGLHEMSLRFRRESAAADEILAETLDSGPPPGLDPRVFRDFASSVGEVRKRVENLSAEPHGAGDAP